MNKILILLLISSACFAQIPRKISTLELTEKIVNARTKTAHGFAVGDWLTIDNTGAFVKGSDPSAQIFHGVVASVTTNTFTFVKPGGTINTLSGLTAGQSYFAQTNGTISTNPTAIRVGDATSTTTLELIATSYGAILPPPSNQSGLATFTNITSNSVTINTVGGNGSGRLIVIGSGSLTDNPDNNVFYTANTVFGSGDVVGGYYAVLAEDAATVNVTGLTANTSYQVIVFEYTSSGFFITYNTLTGINGFTTLGSGTTPTQQFVTTKIRSEEDRFRIQGTRGNGDNIVVVASTQGQPDTDISDGVNPTAGAYSTGTAVGNGYVVYEGAAHDFHITGFSRDRMAWWKITEREDTGFLYNTQNTIDSAWSAFVYDSLFDIVNDWTVHQTVGFTASTVSDTLNLSGNPAGFQDYIIRDDILPDSLEEVEINYTFKISGALTTSTIGTGPIMIHDLSTEANRAVYGLFVTDTDNANFGRLQIYSGTGTVSPTALTFRSQTSGTFTPAQDSVYSISLIRTIENGVNAFYTLKIIDLYDSAELTTSWLETNAPSSEFLGSSIKVGIWQNGGPFKVNPFSVTRVGLDDIIPAGGGGPLPVTYEVFVTKQGSDSNNCTEAQPCLTAVRAAARVAELGAGTDVFFGPGTYTETSFVVWPTTLDTLDGSGDNQTIFKGSSNLYTDVTATFPANGNPFSSYGYLFSFTSGSSTDVTTVMRNFSMEGNRNVGGYDNSMKGGIFVNNRDNINLDNVDIKYFWSTGIWAQSVDSLVLRGCHLQQNSFSNPSPAPSITYSFGNIQLFGTTTKIWVINCFIDSPLIDQGQGIQHSGSPNFYRVDLHVHGGTIDVGNSTDAEGHHFAMEILYYFMQAGDSISIQNVLMTKNLSFNYTGAELGTHFIHGNRLDFTANNKNLAIEAQIGNAEICHNYFTGVLGKVIGTYNGWGERCPRDCHADNQVWDNLNVHHNIIEHSGINFVDGIFGDFKWRRNNFTFENNTIIHAIFGIGAQSYIMFQPGNQGTSSNWLIQNNAFYGIPISGSSMWGASTLTASTARYNKATNLNVAATKSGVTSSNNTVTGSGNTLGFNLSGSKFPVVSGSYYAWPTSNTVLKNTGFGGLDIGAYTD